MGDLVNMAQEQQVLSINSERDLSWPLPYSDFKASFYLAFGRGGNYVDGALNSGLRRDETAEVSLPSANSFWLAKGGASLVARHSGFDGLIPSQSRIGKFSGGTRISMLLGAPA